MVPRYDDERVPLLLGFFWACVFNLIVILFLLLAGPCSISLTF